MRRLFGPRAVSPAAVLLLGVLFADQGFGSNAPVPAGVVPPFHLDAWTTANGLPHNSVQSILQTRDGFLWIATRNGLARFDGVTMRVFQAGSTKGISSSEFTLALWEDRSGILWAGTRNAGVVRYQDGGFQTLSAKDGLPGNQVFRVDEGNDGVVWVYTDLGLAAWKDGHFLPVPADLRKPISPEIRAHVGFDSNSFGYWRLRAGEWERFAYGGWTRLPLPALVRKPSDLSIGSIYEDGERRLWYGLRRVKDHYYCVDAGKLVDYSGLRGWHEGSFVDYRDSAGYLWLTDHQGHTSRWKDGRLARVSRISTVKVFRGIVDRDGNEWISTQDQGLFRLRLSAISSFPNTFGSESPSAMVQLRKGPVLIGGTGLVRYVSGKTEVIRKPPRHGAFFNVQSISALLEDRGGKVWVGTNRGLFSLQGGRLQQEGLEGPPIQKVTALAQSRSGLLAIGTESGLRLIRDGSAIQVNDAAFEPRSSILCLLFEGETLWVGTATGVFSLANGIVRKGPGVGSWPPGPTRALALGRDGSVWIGTASNGLFRVTGGKLVHYDSGNGLPTNGVQQILEDHGGAVWVGGRAGLYRLQRSGLDRIANGSRERLTSLRFGMEDGLSGDDFMDGGQPACFRAEDGRLWFSTFGFVSVIDPSRLRLRTETARPIIDGCVFDHEEASCGHGLELHPKQDNLEIRYTAVDLERGDGLEFKYRLVGLDRDWVEAGKRRSAYYSHLPPGSYSFEAIAANGNGIWSAQSAVLPVVVLPALYQTWWFRLLLVSTGGALLYWTWHKRFWALQRAHVQQQAFSRELIASQERERKRIAAELHDSIGQRLAMINNMALLSLEGHRGQGYHASLQQISEQASQAIGEVREISYNLRPFRLDRLGLTKTLQWIISSTGAAADIRIEAQIDDVDRVLPNDSEINLFRIVQEGLANIVKHSEATDATVSLIRRESRMLLTIIDNGRGFPLETQVGSSGGGGFGLTGIAERATLLGGRASVESTPGQGTRVHVEIHLPEQTYAS